jgi:c-di-GMP-binding flagellar brake protein YcgR
MRRLAHQNMPIQERRRYPRVTVQQIVSLTCPTCAGDTSAVTQNISLGGVFLRTGSCVAQGSEVAVLLVLPVEVTRTREVRILCQGIVLRREEEGTRAGIAISFNHYEPFSEFGEEAA